METDPRKTTLITASLIFLLLGMYQAATGPVLSELAVQTSTSLAIVGGIFTFLFLGSFVGQILVGPIIDRIGQKAVIIISLLIMSVGILGFCSVRQVSLMFMMVFLTGLGQGGLDIGGNLAVSEAYPQNNTSFLNLLHFFFGFGAFIGPAFISLAIRLMGFGLGVHRVISVVFMLMAVAVVFTMEKQKPKPIEEIKTSSEYSRGNSIYVIPVLWIMGGVMLIFIGIEYGLGSWVTRYMEKAVAYPIQNGALVNSAYWGALACGRLVIAWLSNRISRLRLLTIAVGSSLMGGVGLVLFFGQVIPTIISIVWISFSYGTVIPTTVAYAARIFENNKGKALGLLSAMGNIGGLSIPWAAGFILETRSALTYVWFIMLSIGFLLMLILLIVRDSEMRRKKIGPSSVI